MIVEINGVVEAVIGSVAHSRRERSQASLIDVVDYDRGESAYDELLRLHDEIIPEQTRVNLRGMRDQIAAHLEAQATLAEIMAKLDEVSVKDLFRLADKVLDWLDTIALGHVDLGSLVIGYRQLQTLAPADGPTLPAQFQPPDLARFLDQPYLIMTGGGFGPAANAVVAGVISGRATLRRQPWFAETRGHASGADAGTRQTAPSATQTAEGEGDPADQIS